MSSEVQTPQPTPQKRPNLRTPEVMARVQEQVETHYRSQLIEQIRANGGTLKVGQTTIRLAKQFGFCYGVERAIDLAYAARKVFPDRRIFIVGEIIHNPDVNAQIAAMGIQNIARSSGQPDLSTLTPEDIVLLPAFGAEVTIVNQVRAIGCQIVDTTCGDVMSVWKRVRQNASEQVTSIIHGKAQHEETRATASRAVGNEGLGHYLIVRDLEQTKLVTDYIRYGGDKTVFLTQFAGAHSDYFDPDQHLKRIGVANQTTMLRSETEEIQRCLRQAIADRDNGETTNFRFFDTICGATQERQDALFHLLNSPLDFLMVVGGYNSSNTTHLVEIGNEKVPTYFVRDASRLVSCQKIVHFDLHQKEETETFDWLPNGSVTAGITAGASCPNNLIESVITRILDLRGEKLLSK